MSVHKIPSIDDDLQESSYLGDSASKDVGTGSDEVAAGDHLHDSRYYTENEADTLLLAKSNTTHNHDGTYLKPADVDNTAVDGVTVRPISSNWAYDHAAANVTSLAAKQDLVYTINPQTGTTYTLASSDAGKLLTLTNADAITVTIPTNATVAFVIGTRIDCVQGGAGAVTFDGTDITINSKGSHKTIAGLYVGVTLLKTATDTWLLIGDLI